MRSLHARHVFVAAGLVVFLQADLHEGRVLRGVGGIDGGEIGRGADVGNDHAEIVRRNHLPHQALDFGDFVFGDGECACRSGALRLITNWPASVRGKKESPSRGKSARLAPKTMPKADQGQARPAQHAAYQLVVKPEKAFEAVVEPDVEAAAERPAPLGMVHRNWRFGGRRAVMRGALMNRAQKSGTTVMATANEAKSESATASASAENRNLLTPYRKVTGKKTTTVVSVAASTGKRDFAAAFFGRDARALRPVPRWR